MDPGAMAQNCEELQCLLAKIHCERGFDFRGYKEATELGRAMVLAAIPPEDIAEMHEEVLARLAEEDSNLQPAD